MAALTSEQITEQIEDAVHRELAPFDAVQMSHPAWLDDHPSGFGTVCAIEQGNCFFYNPTRIASTIESFNAEQSLYYVDAIIDWWVFSTYMFMTGLSASTVLLAFASDHPEAFSRFATQPDILEGRFTLAQWLAPSRKEAP